MSFFSNPAMDMQVTIALLAISMIVSIAVYVTSRNTYKALTLFSLLANISFLVNIGSFMFLSYGLIWFQYLIVFFWLPVNIFFIIKYFKKNESH